MLKYFASFLGPFVKNLIYVCYSFKKKSCMTTRVVYFLHPSPCFQFKNIGKWTKFYIDITFCWHNFAQIAIIACDWLDLFRYQGLRKYRCVISKGRCVRESGAYFPWEPRVYFPRWEPDARRSPSRGTYTRDYYHTRMYTWDHIVPGRTQRGTSIVPRPTHGTTIIPPVRTGSVNFETSEWSTSMLCTALQSNLCWKQSF